MTSAIAVMTLKTPAPASAQDSTGPILSAVGSVLNSDGHSTWAGSVSFGYRFNSSVELQLELTGSPEVRQRFDGPRIALNQQANVADSFLRNMGGAPGRAGLPDRDIIVQGLRTSIFPIRDEPDRALFFTTNARIHLPLTITRLAPYVTMGGGIGNIRRRQVIDYGPLFAARGGPFGLSLPVGPGVRSTQEYFFSETAMVLTLGGGLAVKVTDRFSVDADLRYFRTVGNQDLNIGRFGGGVSYRF